MTEFKSLWVWGPDRVDWWIDGSVDCCSGVLAGRLSAVDAGSGLLCFCYATRRYCPMLRKILVEGRAWECPSVLFGQNCF